MKSEEWRSHHEPKPHSRDYMYVGKTILVGNHVTNTKPTGDVIIQGADIKPRGMIECMKVPVPL